MKNKVEDYRRLTSDNESTDYSDKASVRKHNGNVKTMYSIVKSLSNEEVHSFVGLLDEPCSAQWLAHQLLECHTLPNDLEGKCLRVIENLAKGDRPSAMGERMWLEDWKRKSERK